MHERCTCGDTAHMADAPMSNKGPLPRQRLRRARQGSRARHLSRQRAQPTLTCERSRIARMSGEIGGVGGRCGHMEGRAHVGGEFMHH